MFIIGDAGINAPPTTRPVLVLKTHHAHNVFKSYHDLLLETSSVLSCFWRPIYTVTPQGSSPPTAVSKRFVAAGLAATGCQARSNKDASRRRRRGSRYLR